MTRLILALVVGAMAISWGTQMASVPFRIQ